MEGGTKKPWKQKGTGRARAGSNTSSIWVGGAVAFGPQPRDYTTRLSKRSRLQALMSVLTEKVKKERLLIVDSLSLSAAKTKEMAAVLKNLGADKGRALILLGGTTEENEVAIEKSARNIKGVKTLDLAGVNVYDLLYHKYLVCTKDVVKALQERLAARK